MSLESLTVDLESLPIIDWEAADRAAGNKRDLAEEILSFLMNRLSSDISAIQEAYQEQNYVKMLYFTHKLHGALCYCGTPRLRTVIAHLESTLKKHIIEKLPSLVQQLDVEGKLLLERYSCLNN